MCGGLFMETTNGMALAVKTAEQLKQRLANAKQELPKAINSADLEQITALSDEIKLLPQQIRIKEIHELKLRLLDIEKERQITAERIKDIMNVRRHKNLEYVDKVDELMPYKKAVDEWETRLSFAKNDEVLLLQERRELNAKIFSLSETFAETL